MSEGYQQEAEELQEAARQAAAEGGEDIEQQVHDIALRALSRAEVEPERIKTVVRSVLAGVDTGVAEQETEQAKATLVYAVRGLDEALAKSAHAMSLALEEAMSRLDEFNTKELKGTLKEVENLEGQFLSTMTEVAKNGGQVTRSVLEDLVAHAQHSGTAVGSSVAGALDMLRMQLQELIIDGAAGGAKAAQEAGHRIGQIAKGILGGLADAVDAPRNGRDKPSS